VPDCTYSLQEIGLGAPGSASDVSRPAATEISNRVSESENTSLRSEFYETVNDLNFSAKLSCFKSCVRFETSSGQLQEREKNFSFQSVRANVRLTNQDVIRDRWM
jgi:hypothetical protein